MLTGRFRAATGATPADEFHRKSKIAMRPSHQLLLVAALSLCGCKEKVSHASAGDTTRNDRSGTGHATAPLDQKNNETDLRITQDIRKAIVDRSDLSTNAHNVKVITENGIVTLRGPVDSAAERDAIDSIAASVANVARVDNQIEVKSQGE